MTATDYAGFVKMRYGPPRQKIRRNRTRMSKRGGKKYRKKISVLMSRRKRDFYKSKDGIEYLKQSTSFARQTEIGSVDSFRFIESSRIDYARNYYYEQLEEV